MAVQYIDHAIATGSGTTVTWTIPTHNVDDLIILGVRFNTTSTSSTLPTPSGYTLIFGRRRSGATPYPNWVFAKNATGSDSASVSHSVTGGWQAIAIVVRGHMLSTGGTHDMFVRSSANHDNADNSLSPSAGSEDPIEDPNAMYLILNQARLAVTGTCAVTTSPSATFTEVVDTYASNLHTQFAYVFPGAGTYTTTSTWSTSNADTTEASQWRFVIQPPRTGTVDAVLPEMTADMTGTVMSPSSGTLDAVLPEMTSQLTGTVEFSGTVEGTLPEMTAQLTGGVEFSGTLSATLPEMTASLTGVQQSALVGVLPEMTASMSAVVEHRGVNIVKVSSEDRFVTVTAEQRRITVPDEAEDRRVSVAQESRRVTVPDEDRFVVVV